MSRVHFQPNPKLPLEMAVDVAYKAGTAAAAKALAAKTRELSPRGDTGDFAESIGSDGNSVTSSDPFAHLVEFGSANNPPYAPFRRAIRGAGLRLDEPTQ